MKIMSRLYVFILLVFLSPAIVMAIPEDDAFMAVVMSCKNRAYTPTDISNALVLIDRYLGKYTQGVYVDDLMLLKGLLLNKQHLYSESNNMFNLLLRDHPFPVIEKNALNAFTIWPVQWLQLDVLTYINSIRAENYMALNDSTQASAMYTSVLDHLRKESLFKAGYKDKYFEFYENLVTLYLQEKNVIKAKRFAKEYMRDETNKYSLGREKMKILLTRISLNYSGSRDPFSKPAAPLTVPLASTGNAFSAEIQLKDIESTKVFLTGVIIDTQATALLRFQDQTLVKQIGDHYRNYRVIAINKSSIVLANDRRTIVINLGEGRTL